MTKRDELSSLVKFAKKKKGNCLSKVYTNKDSKYIWRCNEGHTWQATWGNIKRGSWCPKCIGRLDPDEHLELLKKIAKSRGGELLSTKYQGNNHKLKFKCSEGHTWWAVPASINRNRNRNGSGSWCFICERGYKAGSFRDSISVLKKFAKEIGWKCHSTKYVGTTSKYKWECDKGHRWEASWHKIQLGRRCPECAKVSRGKKQLKYSLEDAREIASMRGGECLSKSMGNVHGKLKWRCINKHEWSATFRSVYLGTWCSRCHVNYSEEIVRKMFEKIFGAKFDPVWPEWLRNRAGYRLELDGYNKKLEIAFEHQGEHHYSLNTHYIKKNKKLEDRKKIDALKRRVCKRKGVTLIVVPELGTRLKAEELEEFLLNQFKKKGLKIPNYKSPINYKRFKVVPTSKVEECKKIAEKRGGEFLSNTYLGGRIPHKWKCEKGHIWEAAPETVKGTSNRRGSWCPRCVGRGVTVSLIKEKIMGREIKLCESEYVNPTTKMKWKCLKCNNEWKANWANINNGRGCPNCANARRGNAHRLDITISDMQAYARKNKGKFLSKKYIDATTKYEWSCQNGHKWLAGYSMVRMNTWCKKCKLAENGIKRRQKTLEEVKKWAEGKGGKCLSKVYDRKVPVKFKCEKKHSFELGIWLIKKDRWCPICKKGRVE